MKWLKKLFRSKQESDVSNTLDTLKVIDERDHSEPIELMTIKGEDDPMMAHMLSAAMQSDKPVMGTVENGTLTIKESLE